MVDSAPPPILDDHDYPMLNGFLVGLCREAAHAIRAVYDSPAALAIDSKSDNSPLTAADLASHHIIVDQLRSRFPDVPVLSEESTPKELRERRSWERYWLVDPLDGTKEFIERTGEFTINIALVECGVPRYGMIFLPLENAAYTGAAGWEARKITARENVPIHARAARSENELHVLTSRRHRGERLADCIADLAGHFKDVERRYYGSALKFCFMAEGDGDFYPRFSPCSEWDTAAGHALLNAAGGEIMGMDFKPLTYNQRDTLLNPHFYAVADAQFGWRELLK